MKILKVFAIALTVLLAGAFTAQAQVELACVDGKGQALIYPYFNINNPASMNYMRLVNTALTQGVAAKVVVRRASDSQECLNFIICPSAKDEWSSWILPVLDANGNVTGGQIVNADSPNGPLTPVHPTDGVPLTWEGCTEGYVEIISATAWAESPGQRVIGSPGACADVALTGGDAGYPDNVLIGDMNLINADALSDSLFAYNAKALRDFREVGGASIPTDTITPQPTLADASGGVDAVDQALVKQAAFIMHTDTFYAAGDETGYTSQNDFIVLFPTKGVGSGLVSGSVYFKPRKWDNAEHTEFGIGVPSPFSVTPDPFPHELNYVRIGPDGAPNIFTTDVFWGNLESVLMDQALVDELQRRGLAIPAPAYPQGFVELTFLDSNYNPLLFNTLYGGSNPEAKPAIVLRFERVTGPEGNTWTHALDAQYDLP